MEVKAKKLAMILLLGALFLSVALGLFVQPATGAEGASLLFSPASGSFTVGSTFNVSIQVNTGGKAINAVKADIKFPPTKLQVVNPSAGTSFISIWVDQPTYSNVAGTISFQGGLPNPGITTNAGIVSTITFRAISPGPAKLTFVDTSRVLANDGQGTDILTSRGDANLELNLAAPEGPVVSSHSHPDQNAWSQNRTINFEWDEIAGATGYSYVFDQNSRTTPLERTDATTSRTTTVMADKDGRWYFHVRAKIESWGGTSHYAVLIDSTPPAAFTPILDPPKPAPGQRAELKFFTTDAMSGIEHYEMQLLYLDDPNQGTPFFTEQTSPVRLPDLPAGKYQVSIRVFDQAGNSTDGKLDFAVATPEAGPILGKKPLLQNTLFTNLALIGAGLLVLALLVWLIARWRRKPQDVIEDIKKLEKETLTKESELAKTIMAARALEEAIEDQVKQDKLNSPANSPSASNAQAAPEPEAQAADFLNPENQEKFDKNP
ncbi:hypothetical protein C4546_02090 [Candidatus Parcubacteria bacterium]|jgi:hypothetical protein|nr:MAG: hypothetical protein C4546_02090 [Candidatus Parcubacteria bacterium]